jgi:hypothetical protein
MQQAVFKGWQGAEAPAFLLFSGMFAVVPGRRQLAGNRAPARRNPEWDAGKRETCGQKPPKPADIKSWAPKKFG